MFLKYVYPAYELLCGVNVLGGFLEVNEVGDLDQFILLVLNLFITCGVIARSCLAVG